MSPWGKSDCFKENINRIQDQNYDCVKQNFYLVWWKGEKMCMCVHVFVCKGDCWKQKTCLRIKRKSLPRLPSCCLVAQLCWTLCDPMDYSSPGSSVHEISQATILEWVAISFSRSCYMMCFASILWIIWKREEWSDMKEVDAALGYWLGESSEGVLWTQREANQSASSSAGQSLELDSYILGWSKIPLGFSITSYRKTWTNFWPNNSCSCWEIFHRNTLVRDKKSHRAS